MDPYVRTILLRKFRKRKRKAKSNYPTRAGRPRKYPRPEDANTFSDPISGPKPIIVLGSTIPKLPRVKAKKASTSKKPIVNPKPMPVPVLSENFPVDEDIYVPPPAPPEISTPNDPEAGAEADIESVTLSNGM
jgi:hypothetical protein